MRTNRLLLSVEIVLLFIMFGWGTSLALPPSTFESSPQSYHYFTEFAPEGAWATVMLALPLAHAALLILQFAAGKRMTGWRQLAVSGYTGLWLFVFIVLLIGNPAGTGWMAYLGYALLASIVYFYIGEQRHGR